MQKYAVMTRLFSLCLFIFTVATTTTVFAQGHKHQDSIRVKAEEEVIAFLDSLTDAGLKRDVSTLDRLYSDDYFHTNPDGSLMSKSQVLASYKAEPSAVIDSDQHDEDKVWVHGNIAFVNTRVTIRGRYNNTPYERQYRITYLF